MFSLNLPPYPVKTKVVNGKRFIFDSIRNQFVVLTPEEWVRQHFVHFLINHKGYTPQLIGTEVSLSLNGMKKRCDNVVYNSKLEPVMILEYKAPQIEITQATFDQISTYNLKLKVNYLVVSNGINHYICLMDYERQCYSFLEDVPNYNSL